MDLTNSLLRDLVTEYANLRPQIYFKSSLIALSLAIQDLVLADNNPYIVIANFQQEKLFRQQESRFQTMASKGNHVYILGVPELNSSFAVADADYATIPTKPTDTLAGERYLVIIGQHYSACLAVREKLAVTDLQDISYGLEEGSRFEGIWSFDRNVAYTAADWLLGIIANYRPELTAKTRETRELFKLRRGVNSKPLVTNQPVDLDIFAQRLVTYLQSSQYKLLKAYKAIATAERKESLVNKIASAQRSSLNPQEILKTTVKELGQLFPNCRCILYPVDPDDTAVQIEYESKPLFLNSLVGQMWSIAENPLFIAAQAQKSTLAIEDVASNSYLTENPIVKDKIARGRIHSWLMVSIRYQGKLLGMLELHYGGNKNFPWKSDDIALVEAVSTSAGAALTQANAYTHLVQLNLKLEAIERVQSNLIAIVGHELRTPLSTIRVCLESLSTEPDIPLELKNIMLETALGDTERLGQLIQNFLTLSNLEAGKVYSNIRNIEPLTIDYALNLVLRRLKTNAQIGVLPEIRVDFPTKLPSVLADIDGLVEVFSKLLDNGRKFTPADGKIMITAQIQDLKDNDGSPMLEIIVADSGRGIDRDRLETIFDRFSQSEGYLRRTVNGAGLGLIICRRIIQNMGGEIWATSRGENKGSEFHFTLPIES
ncbi:GAF domain-containing protein [Waterburya agarophytonicola K14]|uniref:histidine kinase n=1 Tax=Waterburya agarophytonicola KI4 TaxID=2874699 RepID=A0A964FGM1_9CYAN|nr:ATP-binding protein [Waterburya agarophytonicola]MCC0176623.1 GAF domain-containing protein [Waterburya agarophytonicola KI4]